MNNRIKYACDFCSFKFTRNRNINFLNCPYCGKPNSCNIDKGNIASTLLNEVSKLNI
ncbi:hypothetical protein HN415_01160 [Candidatus Woesearchaeota archaeon]|nr:hypothetical protein [Candidatus Woesearchaeota archaeon]